MMGSPLAALRDFELVGRASSPLTLRRPLIPFLKEPWSSKSKYPAILLETFLYGVYFVLFCSCAFIILRRKTVERKLLIATSLLFLLGTADMLLTLFFFFRFVLQGTSPAKNEADTGSSHEPWNRILEVKFTLYVVANLIASGILIHRCHALWQDKRIVIAPIAMGVVGTVIGFVSISASQLGDKLLAASFITSAAANLSVTFLIAIKMALISKKIKGAIRMNATMMADQLISLLLDSGAFYSLSIFLYLVFHTLVIDASLTQIGGVTITAMLLRNFQSCKVLDGTNTALNANATMTQADLRGLEGSQLPTSQLRAPPTFTPLSGRMPRSDYASSINSEYK